MLSKMKKATKVGSRIAEVPMAHLCSRAMGSGESNVRRGPSRMIGLRPSSRCREHLLYKPVIATYIWVLSNRKAESRKGKVQ